MRHYSEKEMARWYEPGERITFCKGTVVMTAEKADRFAVGLVELDRETGKYRRTNSDAGLERMIVNEAKYCEQLLAGRLGGHEVGNRLR